MENSWSTENIRIEFNSKIKDADKYLYYVRSTRIQEMKIKELSEFLSIMRGFKKQARDLKNEGGANLFFHFQCVLNSYISILQMWVLLKSDKNHDAWNKLIDSQEYYSIAIKAVKDTDYLDNFIAHLKNIENSIFPGFSKYNSVGLIILGGECSICGKDLDNCLHLEDKVYMGRLCRRIKYEIVEMDHTAFVDNPKDRRCIITHISTDDGYYKDYFTWEKTEKIKDEEKQDNDGLIVQSVVSNLNNIEFM